MSKRELKSLLTEPSGCLPWAPSIVSGVQRSGTRFLSGGVVRGAAPPSEQEDVEGARQASMRAFAGGGSSVLSLLKSVGSLPAALGSEPIIINATRGFCVMADDPVLGAGRGWSINAILTVISVCVFICANFVCPQVYVRAPSGAHRN